MYKSYTIRIIISFFFFFARNSNVFLSSAPDEADTKARGKIVAIFMWNLILVEIFLPFLHVLFGFFLCRYIFTTFPFYLHIFFVFLLNFRSMVTRTYRILDLDIFFTFSRTFYFSEIRKKIGEMK